MRKSRRIAGMEPDLRRSFRIAGLDPLEPNDYRLCKPKDNRLDCNPKDLSSLDVLEIYRRDDAAAPQYEERYYSYTIDEYRFGY